MSKDAQRRNDRPWYDLWAKVRTGAYYGLRDVVPSVAMGLVRRRADAILVSARLLGDAVWAQVNEDAGGGSG